MHTLQEELREASGSNAHLARKRARYGPDAVSGLLPHQRMKDVQALYVPHHSPALPSSAASAQVMAASVVSGCAT